MNLNTQTGISHGHTALLNDSHLSWKKNKHFKNYKLFPSQIRACIIESSGCGKTINVKIVIRNKSSLSRL